MLLLLAAVPGTARDTIGVYKSWAAFRDASPLRCFAIAQPIRAGVDAKPFASIATWPGRRVRGVLYVHLSRDRDRSAGVTLSIGDRRFALIADGANAWAADTASDRAIVAAMRGARSMSVEAVGAGGHPFADVYALPGAATAIDAAALACAGR